MSTQTATSPRDKVQILLSMVMALIETVEAAGPMGAPSGTCYAAFMSKGTTLEWYEYIKGVAIESGKIRESGHLLTSTKFGV